MIQNRFENTASPLQGRSALALLYSSGIVALMILSVGCGGAPAESLEAEDNVSHTEQAIAGSVLDFVEADGNYFKGGLNNIYGYKDPYYNVKYGVPGTPLSTVTQHGGDFQIQGAYPGAFYTFWARACEGWMWNWGRPCGAWSEAYSAYLPYPGSTWEQSAVLTDGALVGAYGAGYYQLDGATKGLPLCSADAGQGQYLGYWKDGGCNVGYGDALQTYPNAQVLMDVPSDAYWGPYSNGEIPSGAMKGGHYGGRPVYACRADYGDAKVPGWTYGDGCNIGWGGSYYRAENDASEVLSY